MGAAGSTSSTGARVRDVSATAFVAGHRYRELIDVTSDLAALDSSGRWIVAIPYAEPEVALTPICARFARVDPEPTPAMTRWRGPEPNAWRSSLDEHHFRSGVERIRSEIAAGSVYQVNLTRQLRAPLRADADIDALASVLRRGNPAPHAVTLSIPSAGVNIASASPELFLRRDGRSVSSSPIKGTATHTEGFGAKDRAENVMIVDLVRNDLGRVCEWGSVSVPELLTVQNHPGLVHLVSTVTGELRTGTTWADLLHSAFPAGSITGAPKIAACRTIADLEPCEREWYCGALGWVDADRSAGELNVAIRTFWISDGHLRFGTGGGITWDSDPVGEWEETELKARHLMSLASTP